MIAAFLMSEIHFEAKLAVPEGADAKFAEKIQILDSGVYVHAKRTQLDAERRTYHECQPRAELQFRA